jgi:hypothetical protein
MTVTSVIPAQEARQRLDDFDEKTTRHNTSGGRYLH